jgi:hypothetical protein
MISRIGNKMLYYRCDLCKQEIEHLNNLQLILRGSRLTKWDICPNCITKLQEILGKGITREYGQK